MKRYAIPSIMAVMTICIALLTTGCPETWLKEVGGSPYGGVYGIVVDTNNVGINNVRVGITAESDAVDFVDDEDKLVAKCTYLTATTVATDPHETLGDGYYNFDRVTINMFSKYIVVWKDGYDAVQVESRIDQFASTYQLPIELTLTTN